MKQGLKLFSVGGILLRKTQIFVGLLLLSSVVIAGDLQWSGRYRLEGILIKNPALTSTGSGIENSYLLHHLVLEPKIIAADGLNIKSRFDIFNNALGNNQAGQTFGQYSGQGTSTGGQAQPPSTLSTSQQDQSIVVSELYLNWIGEFGALVAGRVPFNFGLGMYYNAGAGPFDHSLSTKDIVAYRIAVGNITLMPGYGKVRESALKAEDDINDYLILAEYTNPETDFSLGFLFDSRVAPIDSGAPYRGNDTTASYFNQGNFTGATVYDGYSAYNMNFYVKKKSENFGIGAELGFLTGYSGIKVTNTQSGSLERVELGGFGLATELSYKTGNVLLTLKSGLASGDDADTARYEGYTFSGNYDIAMLMFNHVLGQYDVLKTSVVGTRIAQAATAGTPVSELSGLDTEVLSNAIYFSPGVVWSLGEKYDILTNITYATIHKSPLPTLSGTVGSSLGIEADIGLSYHPHDRFTLVTSFGMLFPGSAWAGTTAMNLPSSVTYGLTTKAAISF